jgi:NADP-dependent 3-hydroxy acid dehydrogenase YdfG
MKKHLIAAAITLVAVSAQAKDIVDTAVGAGNFKTLAAALQAAGLVDTLKGKGPFTVFAPTDEAFAKVPKADLDALLKDKAKLTAVLTYHVVPGKVMAADIKPGKVKTGAGDRPDAGHGRRCHRRHGPRHQRRHRGRQRRHPRHQHGADAQVRVVRPRTPTRSCGQVCGGRESSSTGVRMNTTRTTSFPRRVFVVHLAAAAGAVLATPRAVAQALVSEADPQAKALGYVSDAAKVDAKKYPKYVAGQICANCALYQAKPTIRSVAARCSPAGWCLRRPGATPGPRGREAVGSRLPRVIDRPRIACVTGARGGIGREVVALLRASGHRVAAVGRDAEALGAVVAEARIAADTTTEEGAASAIAACTTQLGGVPTVLAHCVGSTLIAPLHRTEPAQYREVMRVNLDSAVYVLQAWIGAMRGAGRPGSAVLCSSVVARIGVANHEAIAAAKGGLEALARGARRPTRPSACGSTPWPPA